MLTLGKEQHEQQQQQQEQQEQNQHQHLRNEDRINVKTNMKTSFVTSFAVTQIYPVSSQTTESSHRTDAVNGNGNRNGNKAKKLLFTLQADSLRKFHSVTIDNNKQLLRNNYYYNKNNNSNVTVGNANFYANKQTNPKQQL
uniref:Uncharacterized protein n=1 Tax=Glossina pallidipes TaxID=7398 RepID=A0A1A9ZW50_GLOPL